jgi:hypothetical protein
MAGGYGIGLRNTAKYVLVAAWVATAVLSGTVLTSFHQPMREPEAKILTLARGEANNRWRMVHVLQAAVAARSE